MALGDGTAWDETTPSNATNVSDGDDHIRDLRIGTRLRIEKEHVAPAAASVGGEHKFITLQQQASKPTLSGLQTGAVYIKAVSGTDEMFYENSAGTELQLTSGGALNVSISAAYPAGYLYGGVISNNATDPTNDLDITACYCRASDDSVNISVAALTKRVDATFVAGTGNGGLDTGSIGAVADIIYIYAISDGAATTDILFSKDSSAPTMPGGYTKKRLIGTRYWNGSAWELHTTKGTGSTKDVFFYSGVTAVSASGTTSFADVNLATYLDGAIAQEALLYMEAIASGANSGLIHVRPKGSTAATGLSTRWATDVGSSSAGNGATGYLPLNSNSVFEVAIEGAAFTGALYVVIKGYREYL